MQRQQHQLKIKIKIDRNKRIEKKYVKVCIIFSHPSVDQRDLVTMEMMPWLVQEATQFILLVLPSYVPLVQTKKRGKEKKKMNKPNEISCKGLTT